MALYVFVTMRTFLATLRFKRRPPRPSRQPLIRPARRPKTVRFPQVRASIASTRSESGISLIEVLISSLIVAVVAIGTFTAFDTAGRASTDQRAHAQAGQLAQQDQERLRGLTAAELSNFTTTTQTEAENGLCVTEVAGRKWEYCSTTAFTGQKYTGTVFTVTSSARYVSAGQETFACETTGGGANFIATTSSVRWPGLGATRPAVIQSSNVTDNTTGLLVKVFNQKHEPLSGATVVIKGATTNTQTTGATGCVILTGLADKEVKVAVSKASWVDRASKQPPEEQTVKLSPTTVVTSEFVIAEPGSIEATFESEIGGVVTATGVEGETFYARQSSITPPPENFVKGTAGPPPVKTLTLTPVFPFAEPKAPGNPEAYTVYAGDCEANDPSKVTAGVVPLTSANKALVEPGQIAKVKPEVPADNLTVFEGIAATPGNALEGAEYAYITNPACSAASAQGIAKVTYQHKVAITTGALTLKGHLAPKYQPYATELELCVVAKIGTSKWYRNIFVIKNTQKQGFPAGSGTELKFYLKTPGTNFSEKSSTGLKCP